MRIALLALAVVTGMISVVALTAQACGTEPRIQIGDAILVAGCR